MMLAQTLRIHKYSLASLVITLLEVLLVWGVNVPLQSLTTLPLFFRLSSIMVLVGVIVSIVLAVLGVIKERPWGWGFVALIASGLGLWGCLFPMSAAV